MNRTGTTGCERKLGQFFHSAARRNNHRRVSSSVNCIELREYFYHTIMRSASAPLLHIDAVQRSGVGVVAMYNGTLTWRHYGRNWSLSCRPATDPGINQNRQRQAEELRLGSR